MINLADQYSFEPDYEPSDDLRTELEAEASRIYEDFDKARIHELLTADEILEATTQDGHPDFLVAAIFWALLDDAGIRGKVRDEWVSECRQATRKLLEIAENERFKSRCKAEGLSCLRGDSQ